MRKLRERLDRRLAGDAGISIVEVMVAVMVFMILSVGIAYAATTTLRLSRDSQAREVGSNLASGEIDSVRLAGDPANIYDSTRTVLVDDTTYTITRKATWVDSSGSLSGCGDGSGTLQYKAVNVSVDWDGRLPGTTVAVADTIITPDTRINDPSLGTILVRVNGADGTARSSVNVSGTATSSGGSVSFTATDVDGCSFAFKVKPGTYTITLNKSGYIASTQEASPAKTGVVVTAATSTRVSYQYDQAATYNLSYSVDKSNGTVYLPNNLDITYLNSYGIWTKSGSAPTSVALHPFASGYSIIGGQYVAPIPGNAGCVGPDPGAWLAGTSNGKTLAAGVRLAPVAADAGSSVAAVVPLGGVQIKNAKDVYIKATLVAPQSGSGDPGCSLTKVYTFDKMPNNGTNTIALPYGTWKLEKSSSATGSYSALGSIVDKVLGGVGSLLGTGSTTIVTLDPRPEA